MKVTLIKTWNIANNLHIWGISRVVRWGDEAIAHAVKNKISWIMSIKRFSKFFLTLYLDDIFMSMCALNNTWFSEFQKNSTNASSYDLPCQCRIFIIYLSNKQFPTKFEILFVGSIPRLHAIISLRKMQHRAATTVPVLVHIFPN